ncbi:MAG: class I SAM-dependent methyltransferase [Gemmatimonadales bacterium]
MSDTYEIAVRSLLHAFAWNPWFVNAYWPENEPRVRVLVDSAVRAATADRPSLLEVGCATGHIAYLMRRCGFDVTAVDAYDDERRTDLFRAEGIAYRHTNLNDPLPLAEFPAGAFDVVVLGEVFEHILNQPLGLIESIHRILAPGGTLLLTTPNPSTLANAWRLLLDRYVLWGTDDFVREAKFADGKIIDRGEVHYREYPAWLVRNLLMSAGFDVEPVQYVPTGIAPAHSAVKRVAKQLVRYAGLAGTRLFSPGYVLVARKARSAS